MPYSIYISNKDVLEKDKIFFFFNQVLQLLKFQLIKITSYIIPPLNTHMHKSEIRQGKSQEKYNKTNFINANFLPCKIMRYEVIK